MASVDAHVHIWTADTSAYPPAAAHPLPPALAARGAHADLLSAMDAARVHAALLVQPVNYLFDHAYLFSAAAAHPRRLRVVALADVTSGAARAAAHVRDVVAQGAVGVRVNPGMDPEGLGGAGVAAALAAAADAQVPAALFVKGLDGVDDVAAAHPRTSIVLDHFAIPFVEHDRHDAELQRLLDVVRRRRNVYVKASAFFRVSARGYPYADRHSTVLSLVDAAGADRVMFGTDFPFVVEQCSYGDAWDILRKHIPLSAADAAMVAGGTAAALYKLDPV